MYIWQKQGPSWPWSYGSWIYNYLRNQYRLPLMLWVRISIRDYVQHYVIKFVSDLRKVGEFLWILRFPPPIKLTAPRYNWNIVESGVKSHQTNKHLPTAYTFVLLSIWNNITSRFSLKSSVNLECRVKDVLLFSDYRTRKIYCCLATIERERCIVV